METGKTIKRSEQLDVGAGTRGLGSLRTFFLPTGAVRFYYGHKTRQGKQDDYPLGGYAFDVALLNMKYKIGDCITPTTSSYSWYGKVAKVRMIGITDDHQSSNGYALEFVNDLSNTGMRHYGIFSKRIEDNTTVVSVEKCR